MKWKLLISFSPYLMVVVAFLLFVYWNGSVVLGNIHFSCFPLWSFGATKTFFFLTHIPLTLQVQKKRMQLPHILHRCFILVWFLYWLRLLCTSLSLKLWTCFRCFGRVGPFFTFRCFWPLLLACSQYTFSGDVGLRWLSKLAIRICILIVHN